MTNRLRISPALLDGTLVAVLAATVRAVYLWQAARGPAFLEPLVDSQTYHDLAVGLATRGVYDQYILWQPAFYPTVLGGIYALFGVSIWAAKILQMTLGVGTALFVWDVGRRLGGRAVGLTAGALVAVNGVLVFFEGELLATGWAAFWAAALLWLLIAARDRPRTATLVALGVVGALAWLTRPVLLPCVVVGMAWLLLTWHRENPGRPVVWRRLVLIAAALAVILGPVAAFNNARTGHAGLIPPSGAVNFYLGNHPDLDRKLTIRPGLEWEKLIATPVLVTKQDDPWVSRHWFQQQAAAHITRDPTAAVGRLGEKTLHLLSTRELPRNVDVYVFRRWSPLLSTLVVKIGRMGLPLGFLLPAAAAGIVLIGRRLPAVVWLLPLAYGAGLVLVFVAARYRVVAVPWLAVLAGWGVVDTWHHARAGRWRRLAVPGAVFLGMVLLGTVPGPFAQETIDTEPEMWHGIGYNRMHRDGDQQGAEAAFREAVRLRPDYPEAQNRLGVVLGNQRRFREAIPHFEAAVRAAPRYAEASRNLARAQKLAAKAEAEVRDP